MIKCKPDHIYLLDYESETTKQASNMNKWTQVLQHVKDQYEA